MTRDQASVQAQLEDELKKGWGEAPTIKELCERLNLTEKQLFEHLAMLCREGRAVKVKSDVYYAPGAIAEIREKLIARLREKGEITPPEFRDLTGLSRKFMIPLLEFFDGEKLTIRLGDKRVLRKG